MDCLVTGGAGFIGSNLVDALVERGDQVTVLDDISTGKHENLAQALERGATLHAADIRDPAAVRAVFDAARPEVVFHLAAQIDVRYSVEWPVEDAVTNVLGTIRVLDAATATGVRRVVYGSTGGALYGDTDVLPTPEDHPIRPLAPYGQSKYAAETYCELYTRLHGLSTVSLRYSNVYGPRQDVHGEAGVVTADLQAEVEKLGLFYPPDPSSIRHSTIGGNIACNAGGMHGGRYGVTMMVRRYAPGAAFARVVSMRVIRAWA